MSNKVEPKAARFSLKSIISMVSNGNIFWITFTATCLLIRTACKQSARPTTRNAQMIESIYRKRRYGTGGLYLRGRTWWIAWHEKDKLYRISARTDNKERAAAMLESIILSVDEFAGVSENE